MNTAKLVSVGMALLLAQSTSIAQGQESLETWFADGVKQATSIAGTWEVYNPSIKLIDTDYVVVLDNGQVNAGRPFLAKLRQLDAANDLLQVLLLHEFRHIFQTREKQRGTDKALLECDADYFATLEYGRFLLKNATAAKAQATIPRVLSLQTVGARLNKIAQGVDSHGHLTSEQRFSVGSFAAWRAVHEWLLHSKNSGDKRFAELLVRAKSFVDPGRGSGLDWASQFCETLVNGANTERKLLTFWPGKTEFVYADASGISYVKNTHRIENKSEWSLRVVAWPLLGIRSKERPTDVASYFAVNAGAIDVVVPAKGSSTVTTAQVYPSKMPVDAEIFSWDQPSESQVIMSAVKSGPRLEPSNCQSAWVAPANPSFTELFDFLLRAGSSASRRFQGIIGAKKYDSPTTQSETVFFKYSYLPKGVIEEESYLSIGPYAKPSARLLLLKTRQLAEAEAIYATHLAAFSASCPIRGIVDDARREGANRRAWIKRLTPLSHAVLYLSQYEKEDESAKFTEYHVEWYVRPED